MTGFSPVERRAKASMSIRESSETNDDVADRDVDMRQGEDPRSSVPLTFLRFLDLFFRRFFSSFDAS